MTFCSNNFGDPGTSAQGAFLSIFNSHFSHFHHTTIKIGVLVVINSEYLKVQPANGGGATGVGFL